MKSLFSATTPPDSSPMTRPQQRNNTSSVYRSRGIVSSRNGYDAEDEVGNVSLLVICRLCTG